MCDHKQVYQSRILGNDLVNDELEDLSPSLHHGMETKAIGTIGSSWTGPARWSQDGLWDAFNALEYFQQAGRLKCFMHLYAVQTCKNHPEIMVKSWLYEGGRMVPEVWHCGSIFFWQGGPHRIIYTVPAMVAAVLQLAPTSGSCRVDPISWLEICWGRTAWVWNALGLG